MQVVESQRIVQSSSGLDEIIPPYIDYVSFSLIATYIIFTKWLGPKLMEKRRPMNLQTTLVVYSFSLVIVYLHLFKETSKWIFSSWNRRCSQADFLEVVYKTSSYVLWPLFIVKHVELLDTVFFVLRKKKNQISFLHVFHHSVICMFFWWILKYRKFAFYQLFIIDINNFIHVIMYFYYGVAAMGPRFQKYLWWKKYLTVMQIIQFILILTYMTHAFRDGCEAMNYISVSAYFVTICVLLLFCNFYWQSFGKTKKES